MGPDRLWMVMQMNVNMNMKSAMTLVFPLLMA